MNKRKSKLSELEVFSGISILCVVLIHCNAYYLLNILNLETYEQAHFYTRLLDNFVHGAVPMFIFISGYKYALNNIDDSYKEFVLKKIKRVIKPFFIINMIFFLENIIFNFENYTIKKAIIEFIYILVGYSRAYQLWYIPMYIFIVVTYPILYKRVRNDKIRICIILLILFGQYMLSLKFSILSRYPFKFVYYYLFFEMGVIFYKFSLKDIIYKYYIQIIIIYILSVIILTFNFIPNMYTVIRIYYLNPLSIIAYYALSLILINNKLFNYLGRYSFYIFLLHEPIICMGISNKFKSLGIYNSMSYVFVVCILTFIATIILYKIIENTFIKNILFYQK